MYDKYTIKIKTQLNSTGNYGRRYKHLHVRITMSTFLKKHNQLITIMDFSRGNIKFVRDQTVLSDLT